MLGTTELLFRRAQNMGLQPARITPSGLFAATINGREVYIKYACSPLNSAISASLAKNKYHTRLVLKRHGMPNIPFARPRTQDAAQEFLKAHGKIIAKPVAGSGARDVHIITQASQLHALNVRRYILEQYIAGTELRYLVLNNAIVAVHESQYDGSVSAKRPLKRISYTEDAWDESLITLSLQVAGALSLAFAAIDYLIDASGRVYVLEVNTAPGLKWFHAPTVGPPVDIAQLFLESIVTHDQATPTPVAHSKVLGLG